MKTKDTAYWTERFANAINKTPDSRCGPNDFTYSFHHIKNSVEQLHYAISSMCVGYGHSFAGLADDHPIAIVLHEIAEYVLSEDIIFWRGIFEPSDFNANLHLKDWEPVEWRTGTDSILGKSTWSNRVLRDAIVIEPMPEEPRLVKPTQVKYGRKIKHYER